MSTVPLYDLPKGSLAYIDAIQPNEEFGELDHSVSRRLADLGFSDGTPIEIIGTGLFGRGSYAVRLGEHAQFSLRRAEAGKIICRIEHKDAAK